MSKIHQAMRRAEKEGRIGSSFHEPRTPEVGRHKLTAAWSVRLGCVRIQSITQASQPSLAWLKWLRERLRSDSRLIAVNGGAYDALAERLRQIKTDATAEEDDLTSILVTSRKLAKGNL